MPSNALPLVMVLNWFLYIQSVYCPPLLASATTCPVAALVRLSTVGQVPETTRAPSRNGMTVPVERSTT